MKACVCYNKEKQKTLEILPQVIKRLEKYGIGVCLDRIDENCDYIIIIGGDGTILSYGKEAAKLGKPLLGINTGRLGFMATLESDESELDKLERLKERDYSISRRMLLSVDISGYSLTALNDVVFMKEAGSKLPEFRVSDCSVEVLKIRADGIIFSTPTGSTAYALSAGGPIIEPSADCLEFTPLCAHSLFGRTIIFSGESCIEVGYDGYEKGEVYVSVDGDENIGFKENQSAIIKKSSTYLELIDINGGSFYNSVHNKLMRPLK